MSKKSLNKKEKIYRENPNLYMFMEDMTLSFPIALGLFNEHRNFFYIESSDNSLKQILYYDKHDYSYRNFFEDILPEELSSMMYSLIWYGEGYLHFQRKIDDSKQLIGLDISEVKYEKVHFSGNKATFTYTKNQGQKAIENIPADELIYYSLKDAGFPKNLFSNAIKKISKIDSIGQLSLLQDKNIRYDFNKYQKQVELDKLATTKEIYWLFRDFNNPNLNDITLLYRSLEFKILLTKFLEYFLSVINNALTELSKKYHFSGVIKCRPFASLAQLEESRRQLLEGTISFEEINNLLYTR